MFDWFKKKKPEPVKAEEPKPKKERAKTPKEIATEKGEPYVAILGLDVDPENLDAGAFELDWNDKFVMNLIRAGYQFSPNDQDSDIVDRWFQNVCRNVVLETWEQEQAINPNPNAPRFTRSRDIGNGRTEVS